MKLTDYVIQFLAEQGIEHVFGVTGGAVVHLFDSADRHPGMRPIFTHHEQSAAMAAEAYARMRNGLGAAFVTTGPGGTNAITGVCAAWLDSIPCVYISGQARLAHTTRGRPLRQLGTQQLDIVPLVAPITKYAAMVDDVELLRDKFKTKYIFFVDSVFNDDEGAYLEVVDEMLRRKVNIPWTGFFKPGGLTDEIVERMKQTGFGAAEVGTDAASDTTLKRMGKSFTFNEVRECNDLFIRHGIATSHFFMFGGPGETPETVQEGIKNILGLQKSVSFIFMGIRILPDTTLAKLALKENMIRPEDGLLNPVYYLSPAVDRAWLEETLTSAFKDVRHCVFPPDAMDKNLQILHKLGYTGPMWDLLLPGRKPRERVRHAAP